MQLILKKLEVEKVKGVKHGEWDFVTTPIYSGDNGIGKTTLLDSAYYMLSGKTLVGTTFDPKSKRFKGPFTIELEFELDGQTYSVSRRGDKFTFDGVEIGNKAYFDKVSGLFPAPVEIFTNPNYLLNILPWEETRKIFVQLFGELDLSLVDNEADLRVYPLEVRSLATRYGFDRKKIKSEANSKEKVLIREESKLDTLKSVSTTAVTEDLITEKKAAIESLQSKITICEENLATYQAQFKARELVKNEKHTLEVAKADAESKFNEIESKLLNIQNGDYKCLSCERPLDLAEGELEQLIADYQAQAIVKEEADANYQACVLPAITMEDQTSNLHFLKASLRSAQMELTKYEQLSEKKDDSTLLALESQVDLLRQEVNNYNTTLEYLKIRDKVIATITGENINKNFPQYEIVLEKVVKQTGERKPHFDILDDGVSYKMVNHAKQIQIGLDIVSRIQDSLGWSFPILADALESILEPKCSKVLIGTRAYKEL